MFDDYFNFPNWENHEHKAFYEYLAANRSATKRWPMPACRLP